jgi:ABC-type cobalamin/Fe3+-siderophores transport system ATPase subunit
MIKAENLSFIYPKSKRMVLHDFSFSLEAGRVYGLLGRNGEIYSPLFDSRAIDSEKRENSVP